VRVCGLSRFPDTLRLLVPVGAAADIMTICALADRASWSALVDPYPDCGPSHVRAAVCLTRDLFGDVLVVRDKGFESVTTLSAAKYIEHLLTHSSRFDGTMPCLSKSRKVELCGHLLLLGVSLHVLHTERERMGSESFDALGVLSDEQSQEIVYRFLNQPPDVVFDATQNLETTAVIEALQAVLRQVGPTAVDKFVRMCAPADALELTWNPLSPRFGLPTKADSQRLTMPATASQVGLSKTVLHVMHTLHAFREGAAQGVAKFLYTFEPTAPEAAELNGRAEPSEPSVAIGTRGKATKSCTQW
jgi:hypothetical protein